MTLVELLVATTTGLIILASMTSLFIMLHRSAERAQHMSFISNDLHVASERLVGWIRNADGIEQASTSSRLVITGGQSILHCGAATCWIEVGEDGLEFGPLGDDDPTRSISPTVAAMTIEFGLDDDADGIVDSFANSIPAGDAADVLAIRTTLTLHSGSGRAEFGAAEEFVSVLRAPLFERLALANEEP